MGHSVVLYVVVWWFYNGYCRVHLRITDYVTLLCILYKVFFDNVLLIRFTRWAQGTLTLDVFWLLCILPEYTGDLFCTMHTVQYTVWHTERPVCTEQVHAT